MVELFPIDRQARTYSRFPMNLDWPVGTRKLDAAAAAAHDGPVQENGNVGCPPGYPRGLTDAVRASTGH